MRISRDVVDASGTMKMESEILSMEVKPGWKKGTKISFPGKCNQQRSQLGSSPPTADLVFVVDEKPHDVYRRDGNDLVTRPGSISQRCWGSTVVVLATAAGWPFVDVGRGVLRSRRLG
ncbi:hypothetical protein GUJ93_ZPchr0008g12787 [Zizania palustris]|uniref:Chaperone DnaJ C-terminal domain-containing protein n=1 Tax=Zizania palustris TaxID=103762 RepID=A0A8J5VJU9_ZIZPA|nr:hypothetical protein GUJ93_ZPchr0008g12787 [Zizania palustris]